MACVKPKRRESQTNQASITATPERLCAVRVLAKPGDSLMVASAYSSGGNPRLGFPD